MSELQSSLDTAILAAAIRQSLPPQGIPDDVLDKRIEEVIKRETWRVAAAHEAEGGGLPGASE